MISEVNELLVEPAKQENTHTYYSTQGEVSNRSQLLSSRSQQKVYKITLLHKSIHRISLVRVRDLYQRLCMIIFVRISRIISTLISVGRPGVKIAE